MCSLGDCAWHDRESGHWQASATGLTAWCFQKAPSLHFWVHPPSTLIQCRVLGLWTGLVVAAK